MILLVRHPPVQAAGRCYGRLDLDPDPAAVAALAAETAARYGAPIPICGAAVWTSPALRCRAVAEALGPHRVDPRLQELDFGAWEGVAWDDVPRASLDAWAADPWAFAPPGGESGGGLAARVGAFAADCLPGDHVIVTHGGPLKILRALLLGAEIDLLSPPPPPGSVTVIDAPVWPGRPDRVRLPVAPHCTPPLPA